MSAAVQQKPAEPSMEEILASIRRIIADDQPPPAAAKAAAPDPSPADDEDVLELGTPDAETSADLKAWKAEDDIPEPAPVPAPKAASPDSDTGPRLAASSPESPEPSRTTRPASPPTTAVLPPASTEPAVSAAGHGPAQSVVVEDTKPAVSAAEPALDAGKASRDLIGAPDLLQTNAAHGNVSLPDLGIAPSVEAPASKTRSFVESMLAEAAEPQQIPSPKPLLSAATDTAVAQSFSSLANTVLNSNARTLDDIVTDMLRPMIKHWLDDNLPGMVERLVRAEIERVARGGR